MRAVLVRKADTRPNAPIHVELSRRHAGKINTHCGQTLVGRVHFFNRSAIDGTTHRICGHCAGSLLRTVRRSVEALQNNGADVRLVEGGDQ